MLKIPYRSKKNKILNFSPTRIVVFSFAAIIILGTIMLALPIASRDGKSVGIINALFTATSATCVTGLVVVDTYTHWTLFGQLVIISLIQAGGLGIVTLATFFSVLLGRKVGLKGMLLAQESINHFSFEGILIIVKRLVIITFCFEFIGATILWTRFVPMFGVKGIYLGIFHAISAFCNAGFDLMSIKGKGKFVSLTQVNRDPVILITIASLIIIGGLGFIVWKDLYEFRKKKSLLLHTKVVIIMTAVLLVSGTLFFLFFEYNNTMKDLPLFHKITNAFFHSVTPRTAGYNSLNIAQMRDISKIITIILMFIGVAPGSTGGGIKVTTISILIKAVISYIRGYSDTILLKRRVPHYMVLKSLSIFLLSALLVLTVTCIIITAEADNPHEVSFISALYEATSAFGTVGLTTGITPFLSNISKLFIIFTMFLGRVGPLSFAIALSLKHRTDSINVVYPEGKIIVG